MPRPAIRLPRNSDSIHADTGGSITLRGHATNLVGLPTDFLASIEFNTNPRPIHVHGTREGHSELFAKLAGAENLPAAGAIFQDYMHALFGFRQEGQGPPPGSQPRRFRSSYLSLLQDWGFDSNHPQAAVLKGWAESRFGLFPTYHKAVLSQFGGPEWTQYVYEKLNSRYHNNCIFLQLDLLFEFCQWALRRFAVVPTPHLRLYRGMDTLDELFPTHSGAGADLCVRLNNVVSFTDQESIATQFGAYVLEADVPTAKLLFFNELLPRHTLRGEAEFIAIGGDYRIRLSR